jgi:aspartate/methionine/tyrosine aminotransferase
MPGRWIAERMSGIDSSGIRRVFNLAAQLTDPINLSIGQPDFPVPEPIQRAAQAAIAENRNGYSMTQGIPELRERLAARVRAELGQTDRELFVTSGTSGALVLAFLSILDPGDEVIVFDPYFVMYPPLASMCGARCVAVDTYPDFRIDLDRLQDAITPRTKAILLNSPANPTGYVATAEEVRGVAELAARHEVLLISDEIYREFCYDEPFVSPVRYNPQTLVIDGFSKTYGMTGWRVGFAHGPREVIAEMIKLQQYTFVCAPHPFQWASIAALDVDMGPYIEAYRRKRDLLVSGLRDDYELAVPRGAFYAFPRVPGGESATAFVERAIGNNLLVIPGKIFSSRDTHFRISYAATDETIARGIEVLRKLARS